MFRTVRDSLTKEGNAPQLTLRGSWDVSTTHYLGGRSADGSVLRVHLPRKFAH